MDESESESAPAPVPVPLPVSEPSDTSFSFFAQVPDSFHWHPVPHSVLVLTAEQDSTHVPFLACQEQNLLSQQSRSILTSQRVSFI